MKLRVLDNSIRLRLTRTEVREARDGNAVSGRVDFGAGNRFDYRLESAPGAEGATADIADNVLTVSVPAATIVGWADSDEAVSIEAEQAIGDEQRLRILVEKDFACLAPRAHEDESDMFPHPATAGDKPGQC